MRSHLFPMLAVTALCIVGCRGSDVDGETSGEVPTGPPAYVSPTSGIEFYVRELPGGEVAMPGENEHYVLIARDDLDLAFFWTAKKDGKVLETVSNEEERAFVDAYLETRK